MIGIDIDTSDFDRDLTKFRRQLGGSMKDQYKKMAALTCRRLAGMTPPVGTGNKQRDILRKAILKDVGATYYDVGRTANVIKQESGDRMQAAFLEAVHEGDYSRAEIVVRNTLHNIDQFRHTPESGKLARNRTTSKKRVPDNSRPQIVMQKSGINDIKNKGILTAGLAKAGWMGIARLMDLKTKVPVWLRTSGFSSYDYTTNGTKFQLTATNEVNYASNLLSEREINRGIYTAVKYYMKNLDREVQKKLDKI